MKIFWKLMKVIAPFTILIIISVGFRLIPFYVDLYGISRIIKICLVKNQTTKEKVVKLLGWGDKMTTDSEGFERWVYNSMSMLQIRKRLLGSQDGKLGVDSKDHEACLYKPVTLTMQFNAQGVLIDYDVKTGVH